MGWLDPHGRRAAGDRLDRSCRWIFPLVYVSWVGIVAVLAFWVLA